VPEALRTGKIDAAALWEPQPQRAKVALGTDAIEFSDPAVYTEKFNLCTTQANLDDPVLRKRIVAFVRALITAAQRLKDDPQSGWRLVAQTAKLDIDTVRGAWPRFKYPGTLAPDLFGCVRPAGAVDCENPGPRAAHDAKRSQSSSTTAWCAKRWRSRMSLKSSWNRR
jgi:hypothetical protein